MATYSVTKRLGGYPCCHRQPLAKSHCKYLHGYDRFIELEWEGPRDGLGWVVDFGGLKELREKFEKQFDHTVLISPEDNFMDAWKMIATYGAIDLRVMDPTIEGMALWVANVVQEWTQENVPAATLIRVTCYENEKNSATWKP